MLGTPASIVIEERNSYAENETVYFLSPDIGLSKDPAKTVGCPLYGSCVVNEGDSSNIERPLSKPER
ncbi:MAG: hypothetical protein E7Z68_02500 [Thermoplasmata archaeon]|jgi:hypothetical protein|nr:hypothetical protein [Thermoplasmata archaeon]